MPYNLVQSVRDTLAVNWNSLRAPMQYAAGMALGGATEALYELLLTPHMDWHQLPGRLIHSALLALLVHRLPTPGSKS